MPRLEARAFRQHHVSDQALVACGIVTRGDHRFANSRPRGDGGFDLAQFDSESPDFYLVIEASQAFQLAIREKSRQVSGAV